MFCGNCGQQLTDGAKFCPTCGTPVAGPAPAPAPAPEPAPAADNGPYSSAAPGQAPQNFSYQTNSNPYAAPTAIQPQGGMPFVPVQADRSLPMWIILSFITCGIYSWYFLYGLARDMNIMCQDDGEKTPGLAEFILFSIITCGFYAYWWYYKIGNRMQTNAPRYGLQFQENGTTILMWHIIGVLLCGLGPIFAMNIIIKNCNAMAAAYNARMGA